MPSSLFQTLEGDAISLYASRVASQKKSSYLSGVKTMSPVIIVHHHEITLKGNNRRYFEQQLLRNVRQALGGVLSAGAISGGFGRFIIDVGTSANIDEITRRLSYVFGLANICVGYKTAQDIEAFCTASDSLLDGRTFHTIRVDARRPDKRFPVRSMEVNRLVGAYLCTKYNVRANLSMPDATIFIEIVDGVAYLYSAKIPGACGLPADVSGRVVSLLSAGFDSPVASWQIMRRGAHTIFAHFHSMPYTTEASLDQVRQIVEALTRYQFHSKLYVIPFADVQNEIVLQAPQHLRVIFYRRFMVRIAETIARQEGAEALVTGEAVGQVASQTLRNIRMIDEVAGLPILRPLSGTDKEETLMIARRIGTHDISKEPYDDGCSFLAPRRPETWAKPEEVRDAETRLDTPRLCELATSAMSTEAFAFPAVEQDRTADVVPQ